MANKYTEKEFLELAAIKNPLIEVRGKFINLRTQLLCYCKKHDYEWIGYPTSILNGCGCKYCKSEKLRDSKALSTEEFLKRINEDIEPLEDYINQNTKILVRNKICGHTWKAYPNNLMKGSTCPICSHHYKDNDIFIKELSNITNTIISLEDYNGCNNKILCYCLVCKNIFYATPQKLLQHRGCPFCRISKGESLINYYLTSHNINFERQKRFENLRGVKGGMLSYDFYLPYNNMLIEYQGQFHDGTADIQNFDGFICQQEHDKRKREYAKEHNIELLEIWYWDFDNIEQILNDKLHINNDKKSVA